MITLDHARLILSVTYYLSYQKQIGRDFMINESSLKYPIADYLTGLYFPSHRIDLEYLHPHLKKRNIDLITTDVSTNTLETVFEFKLAQAYTRYDSEQKRIFHDLMRLYMLSKTDNVTCYFLIVGAYKDFMQHFRSIVSAKPTKSGRTFPDVFNG